LAKEGAVWIEPPAALAHPFDDGPAALLERSIEATGETIQPDAHGYARLVRPFVERWDELVEDAVGPPHWPRHPLLLARFGCSALRSSQSLAERCFRGPRARALFAGVAGHSVLPLHFAGTAAFAIILAAAGHAVGWPIMAGGAQNLTAALVRHLRSLGGEVAVGRRVTSMRDLPSTRTVLFDLTPRQVLGIAGLEFPARYRRRLQGYRYGPAVFKVDWALCSPIPWRAPECRRAATLHLGGTLEEIVAAEAAVGQGRAPERPFIILTQPSLFDPARAPAGQHTAWGYCHVPNGCIADMTERIEAQVERFAPGFRDCLLARHVTSPARLERENANYVGGDISGGSHELIQLLARPILKWNPYATPAKGVYICSSSTPPGGGVHGLCGYYAAARLLERELRG
jgi:phytoene dehydrogenase-like protein